LGITLFMSPIAPELTQKVIGDLETTRPDLLILDMGTLWHFSDSEIRKHPVSRYLARHYVPCFSYGSRFSFWMRSGSALERRMKFTLGEKGRAREEIQNLNRNSFEN
jgi:hypothetical protein